MKDKYVLRCPNCTFKVLSESTQRRCAKCDKEMEVEKKK